MESGWGSEDWGSKPVLLEFFAHGFASKIDSQKIRLRRISALLFFSLKIG